VLRHAGLDRRIAISKATLFARHCVALRREFAKVTQITIEKHKVLQILVNLERNAKDACDASERDDKHVTVRISARERGLQIQVIDNVVGISLEMKGMPSACTGVRLQHRNWVAHWRLRAQGSVAARLSH
jgi:signal transduction histidine kinase